MGGGWVEELLVTDKWCSPLATFQTYFRGVWKSLQNPGAAFQSAASPAAVLNAVRNVSRAQLVTGGVLVAECLGFFTVGEMVGRLKLVGYHGKTGGDHH